MYRYVRVEPLCTICPSRRALYRRKETSGCVERLVTSLNFISFTWLLKGSKALSVGDVTYNME